MAVKQYRADVTKTLLALSPEQFPSSSDSFSVSGAYNPDFQLLDAKNVLPTVTGYTSYFGRELDFQDDRAGEVQDIITVRTNTGDTLLVSLNGDTGLLAKSIEGAGSATVTTNSATPDPNGDNRTKHLIGYRDIKFTDAGFSWEELGKSSLGSPNPWKLWTWAIVKNNIYFYQPGLGYILHLYGVEKGWVRADYLEPYFIVGEVDQYRWTFHGIDDNLDCTDTKKSVQIPGLGSFFTFFLDKAHYVKHVKSQWENTMFAILSLGASFNQNSYTQVDLDGTIQFCLSNPSAPPGTRATPGPPWADVDFAYLDIVTDPYLLTYETPVTNQQWTIENVPSDNATYDPPFPGQLLSFTTSRSVLALQTDCDLVEIPETNITKKGVIEATLIVPGPIQEEAILVEVSYSYWVDAVIASDSAPIEETLLYDEPSITLHDPIDTNNTDSIQLLSRKDPSDSIAESGNIVLMAMPAAMANPVLKSKIQCFARRETGIGYNRTYTSVQRINLGYVATINSQVPLDSVVWDPNTGTVSTLTGTSDKWAWDIDASAANDYNLIFSSLELNRIQFNLGSTITNTHVTGCTNSYGKLSVHNPLASEINLVFYVEYQFPGTTTSTDGLAVSMAAGIYIGPTLPAIIDETTPGAQVAVSYPVGYFNSSSGPRGGLHRANKYVVTIPPGQYLAIWIKGINVFDFYGCSNTLTIKQMQGPQTPLPDPDACTPDTSRCITLRHDGQPSELTSSCTPDTGVMTVGGFKEFDLTSVVILDHGVPIGSFPVYPLMDSNDLWEQLLLELNAALAPDTYAEGTLITPAQATIDYNLVATMIDFDNAAPVPVLSHDGNCTWDLIDTQVQPLKLAAVGGITSARGRLMAWDRLNAVYTSSNQDPLDFTPDIATQANVGKVQAVQGNIVLCLPWNNGFIIYSTGNITRAEYTGGTYVFDYNAISDSGVIDVRHITGDFNGHFVYSNKGLLSVDPAGGQVAEIAPELTDYFNKHPFPLKTSLLGDRYLCLSILARPPGVNTPLYRNDLEPTTYRSGQGLMVPRQVQLLSLKTFPFGTNIFPEYQITMIFDTVLQKWGIGVFPFKSIFSLNPVNAKGYPAEKGTNYNEKVYYNHIRSLGAVLDDDKVIMFNDAPTDAYLCFGHTKFDNRVWSRMKEVTAEFADYANSRIDIEPSTDGRTVDWDRIVTGTQSTKAINTLHLDLTGEWFNTVIRGVFHLRSFTVKGFPHAHI